MSTEPEGGSLTPATRRIFRLIRQQPGVSRVELAQLAGLSTGTVTQIVKHLRDQGLADEGLTKSGGVGRRRVGLGANTATARLVGISIRTDLVRFSLLDWSGVVHEERAIALSPLADPGPVVERFLRSLQDRGVDVRAVGLATPSFPASAREAGAVYAQSIEQSLNRPVVLLNNGAAAAVAEEWHGHQHPSAQFLLVYFGAGIGGALVHGQKAGRPPRVHPVEIGHIGIAPQGAACICGNYGCVETVAAPAILARRIEGQSRGDQDHLRRIAEESLIYALTSAINVLDVAEVVLAGLDLAILEQLYGDLSRRLALLRTPEGVAVGPRLSGLGASSAALGAALAAADAWGG